MSNNSSSNSKIAKNTLLLYGRMFLLLSVSLYTSRVVLATLGVDDFGVYNVVGGIVSMFAFVNMAMGNASARFITYALGKGDLQRLKTIFNSTVAVHSVLAIAIVVLAETVGLWLLNNKMVIPEDRVFASHCVYQLSILSSVATMMCVPFNATIIAHEKMGAFAYISILDAVLKLFIVFLLRIAPYDSLILYALLYTCVNILDVLIYQIYCMKHFPEVKFEKPRDIKLLHEMTSFAGWSMIGNLACVGCNQGLNILLNIFFGPAVNAARGVAYQVQGAVKSFITNFQTAVNPQITKSYAIEDYKRLHQLLFATSKFSFVLLLCIALPVSLCADAILSLWLVDVPDYSSSFLRLIMLISLIDTLERPINTAMNATGKIKKYQLISCSIQILVVPFAYVSLILGAEPEMVFVVYFIVMIIAFLSELFILRGKIKLKLKEYFKKVILRISMIFCIAVPLSYVTFLFLNDGTIFRTALIAIVSFVVVCITAWLFGLDSIEKSFLVNKAKKTLLHSKYQ